MCERPSRPTRRGADVCRPLLGPRRTIAGGPDERVVLFVVAGRLTASLEFPSESSFSEAEQRQLAHHVREVLAEHG